MRSFIVEAGSPGDMSSNELVILQRYYFDASPGAVFKALTKPKRLAKWFLKSGKIKPQEGSSYTFTWKNGTSHTGTVEKVAPDKTLVLTWPDKMKDQVYETRVSFALTKKGKGTLLVLEHTGFKDGADWVSLYGAIQAGWAYYMTNLKSVLSEGVDLRSKLDDF
jgi:uncharacterized protein YndB with AHSA1/START domain